jgi:hypothetical protein
MKQLNIKAKRKNIDIDDRIIKKERYGDNNKRLLISKLTNNNVHNTISDQYRRNVVVIPTYNNRTLEGHHIISKIKQTEKPIVLMKYKNKFEKTNNLKKALLYRNKDPAKKLTKNHTYHEIKFSGNKENEKNKSINNINHSYINSNNSKNKNEKKLINSNSYQQKNCCINNNIVLNNYRINRKVYFNDFYKIKYDRNKNRNNFKYKSNTERPHKNYSIHEINETKDNKKKMQYYQERIYYKAI